MSPHATKSLKNELPEPKPPGTLELVLRQLKSPLVYILLIAAVLSVAIREFFDAGIILFAVAINTVLGYIQENKASHALEELRNLVQPEARVRRNGKVITISARDVVVGDTLVLETGDRVSADAKLIDVRDVQANEATLTGESMPVAKDVKDDNMVYMGTTIVAGRGEATVTAIGINTRLGQTAELVANLEDASTPLQTQLKKLANILSFLVLFTGLGVVVIGVVKGETLIEMITLSAALAVAAIPEGLLVGVTVILAVGMQRILRQKALTRRLIAAETLGSVSVICTDKTGTITEGEMRVTDVVAEDAALARRIAVLCNNSVVEGMEVKGTMTESALLVEALKAGVAKEKLEAEFPRLDEIPFSSSAKIMATLHRFGKRNAILVKGAPEVLASMCVKGGEMTLKREEEMTRDGLRVIGLAMKEVASTVTSITPDDLTGLTCVGLIGLSDPLRPEAKKTIAEAKQAGVRTIIVTGDHPNTAMAIAEQAGFSSNRKHLLIGAEIEAMNEADFEKRLPSVDIFARVLPPHKVRIVQAWKKLGATVAMIGDGVNDAPALKAADIGVALGSGTEVAKQTSDMVLLDNNLATLVHAIREGRVIFDNIRKVVVYLLTDSFTEIVLIVGAFIAGLPLPILPAQILWINLVTDGFPHVALTLEPAEEGIMKEPPRPRTESVLDRDTKKLIFLVGASTDIALFAIYYYLVQNGFDLATIRTFIFAALGINSLLYVFSIRSLRQSIFQVNPFRNKALNVAVLIGFLFLLAPLVIPPFRELFGFVQLGLMEFGILAMIALGKAVVIELIKMGPRRRRTRNAH